jgi:hypothetical protein
LVALAEILNKVGEFGPAREVVEAALPQVCQSIPCPLSIYRCRVCCELFADQLLFLGL